MSFIEPFFQGFVTGAGLSLMLGTVFFAIVQNSVVLGYKYGVLISVGVIVSDVMFISLALWSSTFAVFLENYSRETSWVGAGLLMLFGLVQVIKKPILKNRVEDYTGSLYGKLFFVGKGFFLNVINPVNFFVWLSLSAMLTASFHYTLSQKIVFFTGSLSAVFIMESLLAVFASRVRKLMNDKRIVWVNRVSGAIFILLGIYLVWRS